MRTRPAIDPQPDFRKFKDTLLLKRAWKRPPLFDFMINQPHPATVLGRPVNTAADMVESRRLMGYDYVQVSVYPPHEELVKALKEQREDSGGAASAGSNLHVIESLAHFRSKRWSWQPVAEGDITPIQRALGFAEQAAEALPQGMKLVLHSADAFTFAWEMIGFDDFCFSAVDDPQFVEGVLGSLTDAVRTCIRSAIQRLGDAVGAIIYSDDIAYTEGLLLGPEFFRRQLFPLIGDIARMGQAIDAPLIYHSDGKLYPVLDDLAALGVRGIQPLEPKSMDPLEIKRRWPGRFCLLGNIDLDLLARGQRDAVERHVRERVATLNATGGYMPGVSNTLAPYVAHENYLTMVETIYSLPNEPLPLPPEALGRCQEN